MRSVRRTRSFYGPYTVTDTIKFDSEEAAQAYVDGMDNATVSYECEPYEVSRPECEIVEEESTTDKVA